MCHNKTNGVINSDETFFWWSTFPYAAIVLVELQSFCIKFNAVDNSYTLKPLCVCVCVCAVLGEHAQNNFNPFLWMADYRNL